MDGETACSIARDQAMGMVEYGLHIKAATCVVGGKQA